MSDPGTAPSAPSPPTRALPPPLRSVANRLKGDAGSTVAVTMFLFALGFVTGPVLSNSLGADGRGDLAAVLVPTSLLEILLAFGLPAASVYLAERAQSRVLYGNAVAFAAIVAVPLVTVLWFLAPAYLSDHDPETVRWFRFFLVIAVLAIPMQTTLDLHRAHLKVHRYNFLRSIRQVVNAGGIIVLAAIGHLTLPGALGAMAVAATLGTAATLISAGGFGRPQVSKVVFRQQMSYGGKVAVGTWADSVVARLDQILLVGLVTPSLLGLYAVAVTASIISSPFAMGLGLILFPRIVRTASVQEAAADLRRSRRLTLAVSVACAIVIALTASWIIPLVFGEEFKDCVLAIQLLLPGRIAADQVLVIQAYFNGIGMPSIPSAAAVLGAVVTIVLLPPLVGHLDIEGAAIATSIAYSMQMGYLLWRKRRVDPALIDQAAEMVTTTG